MKKLITPLLLILIALPSYADWKKGEQDLISSCEATTAKNYEDEYDLADYFYKPKDSS